MDVRRTFPTADGVAVAAAGGLTLVVTVFNIRGNKYRLITAINYPDAVVTVLFFLTHAQYDSDRWKGQL
jgi:mRNA-degrading endonuclease HigB of HigAB toxin-antitoxin module